MSAQGSNSYLSQAQPTNKHPFPWRPPSSHDAHRRAGPGDRSLEL